MPNGRTVTVGVPDPTLATVALRLHGALTPLRLAYDPDFWLGEAFMRGDLEMLEGSIYDLLMIAMVNLESRPLRKSRWPTRALNRLIAAVQQNNTRSRSRRNVAHHYDLSADLYRLFLDRDMQYSCAYFTEPSMSLDEAQDAKRRHIQAKLLLEDGQRVLDIGCGWGGLAISIAQAANVSVLGITLSTEQLAVARGRAEALGLQDRVRFELVDYRTLEQQFDRVVSVGMFEHVGVPQFETYFDAVARLLAPRGVALVHAIGRNRGPARPNSWIERYIFPGGHIPLLSEVMLPLENSGLWLADLEILRLHYAETLRHWRTRYLARKDALGPRYDARFHRMFEFYLASSEASFRHGGLMVFQAQLAHALDAVPLTRDYIGAAERSVPLSPARAAAE